MSSSVEPLRRRADLAGVRAVSSLTGARIRIGELEIDMRRREIHRGGRATRLQDQPFQLLALLLERPGGVVTRAEIERRLWPDGTTVDFEHAVNAAVRRLRVALGDDAVTPHFVETVPRRGYRFVAPVDAASRVDERAGVVARPRLQVRPFATVGAPGEEALSLGLGDEIVAELADRGGDRLAVVTSDAATEAARGAGADYRLDGSIRVGGDRVRVIARLIETRDETLRWASGYDRTLEDAFGVQAEIAAAIAEAVVARLLPVAAPVPTPAPAPAWSASRREWAHGIASSGTRWTSTLCR
jgi:DNA-binding winged helix-turn-helix (wHTH) protein